MRTRYALVSLLGLSLTAAVAQSNALDFDGTGDFVSAPNASALVANAAGITLSCWVRPTNANPMFPDFDGFAGFRNETDADFYMMQISPANTIEARFRNSNDVAYSITQAGLQLNTWQMLVLTYDGAMLRLWINGANAGSVAASGTITSTTTALMIGDLVYDINDYFLTGRVDEVSLWKRALNAAEIDCLMNAGADVSDPDLMVYYKMDQGTIGADNTTIPYLTDSKNNINGELTGLALNGTTSNFVQGVTLGHQVAATFCPGGTYAFNGSVLDSPGVYTASFSTGGLCDSLVVLTLTQAVVNTNVTQIGSMLTCLNGAAQYQWLDCNNGFAPINNAVNQSYTATSDGSYAVRVTKNGCSDTSACFTVNTIGIEEIGAPIISISPVPVTDQLRIDMAATSGIVDVMVMDAQGREVLHQPAAGRGVLLLSVEGLRSGFYFLHLTAGDAQGVARFIKE